MSTDRSIFLDSWALIALANSRDNGHEIAIRRYSAIVEERLSFVTSDYILDEVITKVFKDINYEGAMDFFQGLFELIEDGTIKLERINKKRFLSAWSLREKLYDKPRISFTDITSFVVMRETGIKHVFSNDEHFEKVGMGFALWRDESQ
jgi:uncharacterized protein